MDGRVKARAAAAWLFMALRVCLVVLLAAALFVIVPVRGDGFATDWQWLLIFVAAMSQLIAMAVWVIRHARYAVVRSMEALLVIIAVFLVFFARLYLSGSEADPSAFSVRLDHVSAVYFTVATFTTVGYGDITPRTDAMRLAVTIQMLLNLILLSGVARLIFTAARRRPAASHAEVKSPST
ncbi:potassium channel family protein [Branchiibius hedensis]|uniref:potassium channel family protein n=1 Tax=Branchiibius hedensis TaxID=672460 RepID=UPI000D6CF0C2|nr:potassium channel family protein [Branchiibius hedensis]